MNVFLDSPGNVEFQLKYKESVYGFASDVVYLNEEMLVSEFWKMSIIPKYISKRNSVISLYQNIVKDKELSVIFDYSGKGSLSKVHHFDLNKMKTSLVLNSQYFFAATHGVNFQEIEITSLIQRLVKVKNILLSGNGMVFIIRDGNKMFEEIDLSHGDELAVEHQNIVAYSNRLRTKKQNTGLANHEIFVGPGKIFIEK